MKTTTIFPPNSKVTTNNELMNNKIQGWNRPI